MGITGLITFLEKASKRSHVRNFSGGTVAIDAYCWLHKGAFACADQLVMGQESTVYVSYCMKYVNMLLENNIKPILVFDGRNLPAKAGTEGKRRESREFNKKKGAALLRAGHVDKGRNVLRRAVDVTHEMALNVMKECRKRNVDCIVASYEADSQLAYLNLNGFVDVVITEDSDLLLFGCSKVFFKMDLTGNGLLIERDKIHLSMNVRYDNFSFDKFRYMCILSGCDYLPSLPGIGLGKACKFVTRCSETDIGRALLKLPSNLNMWSLIVTDDYRRSFLEADLTFRCQLVFDPISRKEVPLTEPNPGEYPIGEKIGSPLALQLALGNLDPKTLKKVDNFDPDVPMRLNKIDQKLRAPHKSIWSNNYDIHSRKIQTIPSTLVARGLTYGCVTPVTVKMHANKPNIVKDEPPVDGSPVDISGFCVNFNNETCIPESDDDEVIKKSEPPIKTSLSPVPPIKTSLLSEPPIKTSSSSESPIKSSLSSEPPSVKADVDSKNTFRLLSPYFELPAISESPNCHSSSLTYKSKSPKSETKLTSSENNSLSPETNKYDSGFAEEIVSNSGNAVKRKFSEDIDEDPVKLSQEENLSEKANTPLSSTKRKVLTVETEKSIFFEKTLSPNSTNRRPLRAGLSKPKSKSQQQLTSFGFVMRPKM